MAKRKTPDVADLRRKPPSVNARLTIYIICEGVTEKDYFIKLSRLKSSIVEVEVKDRGGAVRALVDKVRLKERELKLQARKSGNSYDSRYSVWGVPDVDEHPRLEEAKNLANEHELNLALSNPCFEVWGIFHYKPFNRPVSRHEAQRILKTLMSGYCHERHPYFDETVVLKQYATAIQNAKNANQNRVEEGDPHGTPSSKVHELVTLILTGELGKYK